MHTWIQVLKHAHILTCIHTFIYHIYNYTQTYIRTLYINTFMHAQLCIYIHTYKCTYIIAIYIHYVYIHIIIIHTQVTHTYSIHTYNVHTCTNAHNFLFNHALYVYTLTVQPTNCCRHTLVCTRTLIYCRPTLHVFIMHSILIYVYQTFTYRRTSIQSFSRIWMAMGGFCIYEPFSADKSDVTLSSSVHQPRAVIRVYRIPDPSGGLISAAGPSTVISGGQSSRERNGD